jgi:hypothetical protein
MRSGAERPLYEIGPVVKGNADQKPRKDRRAGAEAVHLGVVPETGIAVFADYWFVHTKSFASGALVAGWALSFGEFCTLHRYGFPPG